MEKNNKRIPWNNRNNLIVLCASCHKLLHIEMKMRSKK